MVMASLFMLCGLSALAIDVGFAYTKRLGLQGAADAAALGGAKGGIQTSRAISIASDNGFTNSGSTTVGTSVSGNALTVTISQQQPVFFSRLFGFTTKTVSASSTAIGQPVVPAVLAIGGCATGGVESNSPSLTITGDVASAADINFFAGGAIVGSAVWPSSPPCPSNMGSTSVSGGAGPGTIPTNPWAGITSANFAALCIAGTNLLPGNRNLALTNATPPGVYCSGGDYDINWGTPVIAANITIVAVGKITFSGDTGTINANSGGFVAISDSAAACPATQAINIGNNRITFNGNFYAPNGCLNFSGNQMVINGSLIGNRVQLQAGNTSAINGPSGATGGSAYLQN